MTTNCGTTRCSWWRCSSPPTARRAGRRDALSTRPSASSWSIAAIWPIPHSGLWFHGWTFDGRHNFARALWGRGNAWITLGILDLIDLAEIPPPVRAFLLGVLETQIAALLKLQAPSGAWRTLLDDPTSYEEISATAGFGYGLLKAARLGIGPAECREAGLQGAGGGACQYRRRRASSPTCPTARAWATICNSTATSRSSRPATARRWRSCASPKGCAHIGSEGGGSMTMRVVLRRFARTTSPALDTERLRAEFLVEGLFAARRTSNSSTPMSIA